MTHRPDPERGIWTAVCEFCSATGRCWLVMVADRYEWKCVDQCDENWD